MTLDIQKLKQVAEAATPGPWDIWAEPCESKEDAERELCEQAQLTEGFAYALYLLSAGGKCPALTGCGPTSKANAEFIAAANPEAVLALISAVEEANTLLDQERQTSAGLTAHWKVSRDRAQALEAALEEARKLLGSVQIALLDVMPAYIPGTGTFQDVEQRIEEEKADIAAFLRRARP